MTDAPGSPVPVYWVHWLKSAFLHMAANGTSDFALFDADTRGEFEELVNAGEWFGIVERMKRLALAEARSNGFELSDRVLTELSAGRVRYGDPLPDADRARLSQLTTELYAIIVRIDAAVEASSPRWKDLAGEPARAPDFSWVRCPLGMFTFAANQRPVVRALWEDWEVGGAGLGQAHLNDLAGGRENPLRDLFKGDGSWGTLIVPADRKDTFRLALPPRYS